MAHLLRKRSIPFSFVLGGLILSGLIFGPLVNLAGGQTAASHPSADFIALNLKIDGAMSCSDAKCHGMPKQQDPPKQPGNEYLTWAKKDSHKRSYIALTTPDVKKNPELTKLVAWGKSKNLNFTTSERCISCHALSVPANLQGQKYNVKEGNTCANCHGPTEKWREPHAVEGWADKERKAAGNTASLLKTWGFHDTKDIAARAQKCASCHLAIDAELVENGHPQPRFELAYYCEFSNFGANMATHWREEKGYHVVALWLGGQIIETRDSMTQLADRAKGNASVNALKESIQQALAHYGVLRHAINAKAINGDSAALDAAAKKIEVALANPDAGRDAVATSAASIADAAGKMVESIGSLKPDKDQTTKILSSIAGDATLAAYGSHGMEQQAWAISSLYAGYGSAENVIKPDVAALIKSKLADPTRTRKVTADDFAKALAEVKSKLPM